jgi:hypothetical protein
VNDVQVHVVNPQPSQALLERDDRIPIPGKELGGDEDLVARHATREQAAADALLIAVGLSGVDVPVPELESPAHGVDALSPVGRLPDPEPEEWELVAIVEEEGPPVVGDCAAGHGFAAPGSTRIRIRGSC